MRRHSVRSLAAVLVAVLLLMTTVGGVWAARPVIPGEYTVTAEGETRLLADVNGDETISTSDARLILQACAELYDGDKSPEQMPPIVYAAADVNQDGEVSTVDARLILQVCAELIDEFPAPKEEEPMEPVRKQPTLLPDPADLAAAVTAQVNPNPDTFCNPINISYAYQKDGSSAYREGADPLVQVYKGEYYLFVSHAGGYWWSKDLVDWTFVACTDAQMDKWAPATCVVGNTMYLTHSQGGAIYKSTDPKSGEWLTVRAAPVNDWGDPALLYDEEDGFVYAYYGCSPVEPLYVVKLDPNQNMAMVGEPVECFYANMPAHGFEVSGNNNENISGECWLEGAWTVKHEGKYYLNYAVPGTGDASYADGCYVADSPMGPFTFCTSSPVCAKHTGFTVGAGHGATFQDLFGNWWKVDTIAINVNHTWERRIELIPLTYDKNGNQITDTALLDYPTYVPHLVEENFGDDAQPDWYLLSYQAAVTASSTLDTKHAAKFAADESIRTWWSAKTANAGEWLQVDLGKLCAVNAVQVNFADQGTKTGIAGRNNTFCYNYKVEFSQDGETWYMLADHTGVTAKPYEGADTSHDYYELIQAVGARYIRVTNAGEIPAGGKFALSGLRVFGNGQGEAPAAAENLTVKRPKSDERQATVKWDAAEGAEGYVIRYGYDKDVLNQSYQVLSGTAAIIRTLNMGVDYWFTVDSYNDSGYTRGTETANAPATKPAPPDVPVNQPVMPLETVVEGYAVHEAEEATLENCSTENLAVASGKKVAANLHNKDSSVTFTNVDGGNGGKGKLHIAYANGNMSSSMGIEVNGKSQGTVKLSTTGCWCLVKVLEFDIDGLTPGETNTIRLVGGIDDGFNPDFIQVIYEK